MSSPVPLVLWSGSNYFSGKNTQYLNVVKEEDIEYSLQSLLGLTTASQNDALNLHFKQFETQKPEVVALFVEPKLRTAELSVANVHYLKKVVMETSASSFVIPYAIVGRSQPFLQIFSNVIPQLTQASVIIASPPESTIEIAGATSTTPEKLLDVLNENSGIFSNGVTDLIVVFFAEKDTAQLEDDDRYIAQLEQEIKLRTNGNYVGVFSANSPSSTNVLRSFAATPEELTRIVRDQLPSDTYTSYFPGIIWEAIIVVVTLLIIALVGICCTVQLQTPARFETPKQRRVE